MYSLEFGKVKKAFLFFMLAVSIIQHAVAEDLSDRVADKLDLITIDTHDLKITNWRGDVTLKGTVSSAADKALILQTAKSVEGVDKIIDQVRIDTNLASAGRAMMGNASSDRAVIAKDQTERYLGNLKLKGSYALEYLPEASSVTIKGELPAGTDKQGLQRFWKSSLDFPVDDQVQVRPWPSDSDLKNRVQTELANKLNLDLTGIRISVNNGIVTLTGHKPNHFEADQLATGVWMVEGVRGLDSRVTFDGSRDDPMSAMQKK